jgi:hypothetical protein
MMHIYARSKWGDVKRCFVAEKYCKGIGGSDMMDGQ